MRQVELPWEKPDLFRGALPLRLGNELPVEPFAVALDYYPIRERFLKVFSSGRLLWRGR